MRHSSEVLPHPDSETKQSALDTKNQRSLITNELVSFIADTARRTQEFVTLFDESNPLFSISLEQRARFLGEVSLSIGTISDILSDIGGIEVEVESEDQGLQFLGRITGCHGYNPADDTWQLSIDEPEFLIGLGTGTLSEAFIEGAQNLQSRSSAK